MEDLWWVGSAESSVWETVVYAPREDKGGGAMIYFQVPSLVHSCRIYVEMVYIISIAVLRLLTCVVYRDWKVES